MLNEEDWQLELVKLFSFAFTYAVFYRGLVIKPEYAIQ